MAIARVKDENENWIDLPALRGKDAEFNDNVISDTTTWSSKQIVEYGAEHYYSPFHEKAGIAQGNLAANYPLHIISHIMPLQDGRGESSPSNIRHIRSQERLELTICGNSLIPIKIQDKQLNGITYENRPDGGIKISGTATSRSEPKIDFPKFLPKGVYYWSSPFILILSTTTDGFYKTYDGVLTIDRPVNVVKAMIRIEQGQTVNEIIYPKLTVQTVDGYEPYTGQTFMQDLSEPLWGGTYDWGSGVLRPAYKMFEKRVSDMQDASQEYPGWIDETKEIRKVIGYGVNAFIDGAVSNATSIIGANTNGEIRDSFWLSKSAPNASFTVAEWKAKFPNLTVQILLPYREDLRPTIQLVPHLVFPRESGVTTVYSNADEVEVWGRLDPTSEKTAMSNRIQAIETKTTTQEELYKQSYKKGVNES